MRFGYSIAVSRIGAAKENNIGPICDALMAGVTVLYSANVGRARNRICTSNTGRVLKEAVTNIASSRMRLQIGFHQ